MLFYTGACHTFKLPHSPVIRFLRPLSHVHSNCQKNHFSTYHNMRNSAEKLRSHHLSTLFGVTCKTFLFQSFIRYLHISGTQRNSNSSGSIYLLTYLAAQILASVAITGIKQRSCTAAHALCQVQSR